MPDALEYVDIHRQHHRDHRAVLVPGVLDGALAMANPETLLDNLAVSAATLAAHPMMPAARAAVRRDVEAVRLWRAEQRLKDDQQRLIAAAAAADALASEQPGYRRDLEG